MALEVIGAGFGRTGTLSMKAALEILGFGPCYHMIEVLEHPDHDQEWWDADLRDWPGGPDSVVPLLRERGWRVVRRRDTGARAEGRDWPPTAETMIGTARLDNVLRCCIRALRDGVPGDLLEAGVWRGGTTILMRGVLVRWVTPTGTSGWRTRSRAYRSTSQPTITGSVDAG